MFEQTLEQQKGPGNRWWPKIQDYSSASDAMRNGAVLYWVVCGMTVIFTVLIPLSGEGGRVVSALGLVEAAFFGVVAWRVARHSAPWAIAGFAMYLADKIAVMLGPTHRPGVLSIFFLFYFWHAIRGGRYLKKHSGESDSPVNTVT